jgi:hypothetical protein
LFLIFHISNIVPIIVVFTKHDVFVDKLELEAGESGYDGAAFEELKTDTLNKLCIQPLKEVAGNDVLHTAVSSKGFFLLL